MAIDAARFDDARVFLERGLGLSRALTYFDDGVALMMFAAATFAARDGDARTAARLLGACEEPANSGWYFYPPYRLETISALREGVAEALGRVQYDALIDVGKKIGLERTVRDLAQR